MRVEIVDAFCDVIVGQLAVLVEQSLRRRVVRFDSVLVVEAFLGENVLFVAVRVENIAGELSIDWLKQRVL